MTATIINDAHELVPVDRLYIHPSNPRQGDVGAVCASIEAHGFFGALVVQRSSSYVLAGNHRLKAARQLGMEAVPVMWVDVDDETAKRILLADNRTSDLGTYDNDQLAQLLQELATTPGGLDGVGYDGDDLDNLLQELGLSDGAGSGAAVRDPEPGEPEAALAKWGCATGDIWQLGDQRLIVGDSTVAGTIGEVLLEGELAACVWTDPPYGVDHAGGTKDPRSASHRSGGKIRNDKLTPAQLEPFLQAAFAAVLEHTKAGGSVYVAAPPGPSLTPFLVALGPVLRQCLVWVKDSNVFGRSDYHYAHEMVLYGWKPGAAHSWHGDRKQGSVMEVPRPHASKWHPTTKPTELVARCLRNSTQRGDVVLDPFNGSGSTLIACHELGRKGRGVELDPKYAASTLSRFAELDVTPVLERKGSGE